MKRETRNAVSVDQYIIIVDSYGVKINKDKDKSTAWFAFSPIRAYKDFSSWL